MAFAPRFTITQAITAALTRIERARGFLDAAKLSEDWIRRMGERALVLEAHHATHIEGTRLTLEQSERLLAGTEGLALLDEVKSRGERAIRRDLLAREHDLSDRQALALGRVLDAGRLTIQEFEELCPGVNRRTLQRDLKSLMDKGLFVERGTGPTDPTRHYIVAEAMRRRGSEL